MPQFKLTVGFACYDDAEGAFWTASSLRLHHIGPSETNKEVQLLFCDDHPNKTNELEHLAALSSAKYVHCSKNKGPAHAKNSVFENADGEYVLLLDSHVILQPGAIDYILDGINNDFIGKDMWCGPLLNENVGVIATHLDPKWRGDFYGVWDVKRPIPDIMEIPMHGAAMFLMKREYWPKFSEHFSGFAGEEGYIHEKVRMNGGRVMFHKSLGWVHRFMRAKPITYRLDIIDKIYNYFIAYYEMNRNPNTVANFFKKGQPEDFVRRGMERALAVYPDLMTRFAHLPDVPEIAS
jgi:glycosyltransferase involved in cell wall biosynthesis